MSVLQFSYVFVTMPRVERDLISEYTKSDLEVSKQRSRQWELVVITEHCIKDLALSMIAQDKPIALIARTLKVSRQTIYRTIEKKIPNRSRF